ncbi:MAG: transcriptional regulator [Sumerlaeia bacterium]
MKIQVIKTEEQCDKAMERIDELWGAEKGTPEADELELLALLVEDYEARTIPLGPPDPVAAIRLQMDLRGMSQRDLEPYIGNSAKVSEVLGGKRGLSKTMIRKLHDGLGIPLESLLGPAPKPSKAHTPGRKRQAEGKSAPRAHKNRETADV